PIAFRVQLNPVFPDGQVGARFSQLQQHRVQNIGPGILDLNPSPGGGRGYQESTSFHPVRQYVVVAALQRLDAIDLNGRGARPFDVRAHGNQTLGQVHHFRLAGRVFDNGLALGQGRSHQQVFGAGDRDRVQKDMGTFHALGSASLDIAALHYYLRPLSLLPPQVQVYWAASDGTATRQGDFRLAEMGQHGSQHQDRGPHGFHQ